MRMRPGTPRQALGALIALALPLTLTPAEALPGHTIRASVGSKGTQANGPSPATSVPDTTSPQLSLDGLTVAFSSDATNLVPGDTNRVADVFVRDTTTNQTERVSVSSSGAQANGPSHSPAISVDGRYVAFASAATNLVPGDTNARDDVFLRDRAAGTTIRVSVTSSGRQGNGHSRNPQISLFGRYVVYESDAAFFTFDRNGQTDAFLSDAVRRSMRMIVPPDDAGQQTVPTTAVNDPAATLRTIWSASPSISYDGRYVAYVRGMHRRAPLNPSSLDVFVWDRAEKTHTQVQMAPWMGAARILADKPRISADGRYVAFEAWSVLDSAAGSDEALIRNPLDVKDIHLYDRITGTVGQVTFNSWFQRANGDSHAPSISAGGHYISFTSDATNLVAGDTNRAPDAFVRDNVQRTTSRMSQATSMAQAPTGGTRPSISYEGRRVAFASSSGTLVPGDTNGVSDIFVRDRRTDTPNRSPRFTAAGTATINPLERTTLRLRASDPDRDPIRFGVLQVTHQRNDPLLTEGGLPMGATLDPATGIFRWSPTPDQAGSWRFIFWVDDPRGAADFSVWDVIVRTVDQMAQCTASGGC